MLYCKNPDCGIYLGSMGATSCSLCGHVDRDAVESEACSERDARIDALEAALSVKTTAVGYWQDRCAALGQELEAARKDADRWNWLNWHIGVAWGEAGFTSLIRIVSEKHRALINEQVDKLMAGEFPEAPAAHAAIKEQNS